MTKLIISDKGKFVWVISILPQFEKMKKLLSKVGGRRRRKGKNRRRGGRGRRGIEEKSLHLLRDDSI
jgi:hypothetical protein